ncbi:aldehyde dehydrogenase domain-containing protein [Dactylonectria estremocensis]|uniref:Aldehyde dehydrogenase domain-containing protein n=1 Tax=Dactylonectria estremocensis TaxID=1079267 RepID=A0A9P9F8E9_9HYPO|nr:aldehyde dehydrogenase domain-containing protein [Dactylonectria estremocensis]
MPAETPTPNESIHTIPFLIKGSDYHSSQAFDVVSPATGKVVHRCYTASVDDANAAIEAAAEALKSWRKTPPEKRRDVFLKAAEVMERRRPELRQYMQDETGAEPGWADFNLNVSINHIKDVAGRIATLEGSFPATMSSDTSAIILQEPYGVVLAIAPWNAPYILGTRAVIFPIAVGNTVVFKGSELSPRTMLAIASVFQEAGLPDGVLNVLFNERSSAASVTSALIQSPHVRKINFTGSTAVGRIIARLAGDHLKPIVLELGGKAPAIVWEDADLDLAAEQCALGSFLNSGQICMSTEKILVHKAVRPEFEKRLAAAVAKIFSAENDAPVLISAVAADKNKALVKDAISNGASIVHGDLDLQEATATRLRPIILSNVTTKMDLYKKESFGPTVSILEIETEEEAIRLANDTEYGLSSAVFTSDLRRGLRIAREIETGAVHINNMTVHDESSLPHGGAKSSGYGRFNASAGLSEWVRSKTVTFRN